MRRIREYFNALSPASRRGVITIGLTAVVFLLFSLILSRYFLSALDSGERIFQYATLAIGLIGLIAEGLCWLDKPRIAGWLIVLSILSGMGLASVMTKSPALLGIASVISVVIPIIVAVQVLPQGDFIIAAVFALITNSGIQLLNTFKPGSVSISTAEGSNISLWLTLGLGSIFVIFILLNLRNNPFRVKMILILGSLTIIPSAILLYVNRNQLQASLITDANQSLVLSADQLASAVDAFIQRNLDSTRTEAQIPALVDFLGQPRVFLAQHVSGYLIEASDLTIAAADTVNALSRKDPINIISYSLIDQYGQIQVSTDISQIGKIVLSKEYFLVPLRTGLPYASNAILSESGSEYLIHFSSPIRGATGTRVGVLDVVYSAVVLQQIIASNSDKLGTNVSAMLLDTDGIILAHSSNQDLLYKIINPPDPGVISVLTVNGRLRRLPADQLILNMDGLASGLENLSVTPSFSGTFNVRPSGEQSTGTNLDQAGAARLKTTDWYLVAFVPQSTLLIPVQEQTRNAVIINVLISLAGILVAIGATQMLISPILSLTRTSEQITQGEINAVAEVQTKDEIGTLAVGFNTMTGRLRDLVSNLEERVAERTRALEHRAVQLRAAADVGRAAASIRDLDQLLNRITQLISQQFGFYHVGIFLLDEVGENAVLRAANSEGGQRMLAREHKLPVGEKGIVGFVTEQGKPRIALDVGEDAAFFANPDLPETRSELALPLIIGQSILGALDVQSQQAAAFSEEDITTLQVLADQITIAIDNARLFDENRTALEMARRAYGELSREGWEKVLQTRPELSYVSVGQKVNRSSIGWDSLSLQVLQSGEATLTEDRIALYLPVKIRGDVIGILRLHRSEERGTWSDDDIRAAEQLAEQMSGALDSARLYDDISRRAEIERIIANATSRIGSKIDIDAILQSTVSELGNLIGDSEVAIQIQPSGTKEK